MSDRRGSDITDEQGNDCSEVDGWYAQYALTRPSAGMCPDNCACQQEDAMTTPLDLEDLG